MTTLRVLVDDVPAASRAFAWTLFDAGGSVLERGRGTPRDWPAADRREAVVAASCARVAIVALPPMPAARLPAAVAFAMEDQLAGPAENQRLLVLPQRSGDKVRVAVASRTLLAAIVDFAGTGVRFARAIPEVELLAHDGRWHWCIDAGNGAAFIRTPDGAGFPVAGISDGSLPTELSGLLASASGEAREFVVHADLPAGAAHAQLQVPGLATLPAEPWCWDAAPPAAFAGAPDLLAPASPTAGQKPAIGRLAPFAWPLRIAAAALVLHVAATVVEWAWLRYDAYRDAQAFRALALQSGLATADEPTITRRALTGRHALLRHANALPAGGDPLPAFALAAPALSRLAPGTVKGATYSGGAWTIEISAIESAALRELDRGLAAAGVPSLFATGPAGTRIRLGER